MKIFFLRGVIPAFSLSLILNLAIHAQPGQGQTTQAETQTPLKAPALRPIAPAIDFTIDPHRSKLDQTIEFDAPERGSKFAPRSFKATAYSLRGRTASGVETRTGVVAADPKVLPLGSIVEIKAGSYSGVYTVHDTGSAVKGNLVDVWMPSSKEARKFGRRNIKLSVLRYGPITRTKKSK